MVRSPDKLSLSKRIGERMRHGPSGAMLHGMVTLGLGSGIGRGLGIISIPVLTRLYSPEDFGLLAVFAAFVQMIIPLTTLRYLVAIPLPRNDRTAFALLVLCVGLAFGFSAAAAIVLAAAGPFLFDWVSMPELAPYWWLLGIGTLGASLYEILTMWSTRKRAYGVIARTQILQSALGEGTKILLGLLMLKPLGLLVGTVASHSGGLTRLTLNFRHDYLTMWRGLRWRHITLVTRRYRGFPIFRLPAQLLLVLSMQAPLLFTATVFGSSLAGQLSVAMMLTTGVFLIVGQSISRAYYAEAASKNIKQNHELKGLFLRTSAIIGFPAVCISALFYMFGENAMQLFLGEKWGKSAEFFSYFSLIIAPYLVSSSFLRTLDVLEAHRLLIYLYSQRLSLVASAFYFSYRLNLSSSEAIRVLCIALAFHYIVQYFLLLRAIHLRGSRNVS